MPDGGDAITVRLIERVAEIPAAAWDACAGTVNPFVSHAFLDILEESRSVGGNTGWTPRHLIAEDETGQVIGAVPLYLKSHSQGEYVFDHGWADAYRRAGGHYYPKFQVSIPFTPVPGPRLLIRGDQDVPAVRAALIDALASITDKSGVSSMHVTFCTPEEAASFEAGGWLIRHGVQYHWENNNYKTFDDFLGSLSHSRRKAIRKERREVTAQGLCVDVMSGATLTQAHCDKFFDFYIDTSDRKWGRPYLTRDFFRRLAEVMPDKVALMLARHGDRYVAGALNLIGADTIYGRNWGSDGQFPFLHFETCYYKAIEIAIERGLQRVEAGAQGEHKIQRGYLPVTTYSAHWIADPGFRKAVAEFLKRETAMMDQEIEELAAHSPFKETPE
jgi:predicted N-acyltransferase